MPVLLLLLIDWLGEKGRPEPVRSGGGRACLSELNCGDTRSLYNGQQRGCVCVCSHCQQTTAHLQGTGQTQPPSQPGTAQGSFLQAAACQPGPGEKYVLGLGAHGFLAFSLAGDSGQGPLGAGMIEPAATLGARALLIRPQFPHICLQPAGSLSGKRAAQLPPGDQTPGPSPALLTWIPEVGPEKSAFLSRCPRWL